ncbi:MAG: leucine--tRNA ligase [Ezakiella sp.]|nr:leucine--tRNA ligase [Ezakiella sp.]
MDYYHEQIEKKWQKIWDERKCFEPSDDFSKKKYYILIEFPYPSGEGLHVGHPRSYTALDVVARVKRLQGYNVLFPIGFDAFGLPTERYAIKHHMDPKEVSKKNIANFTEQLKSLGISFAWDHQVITCEPSYYKWTQWIFKKMYEHGLAYKKSMTINWCPDCKIGLANEEVVDGCCERCGTPVEHREKNQWMLAITKYADRLVDGLDTVDFIDKVKAGQRNWIGRSYGAEIDFNTSDDNKLRVYTTRPDTIFGASFLVISPEHPYLKDNKNIKNMDEVSAYQLEAKRKSDFERAELAKDKTGVKLDGVYAINPMNGDALPIFVGDYVLMSYGTGAIMSVPAHDARDYEFAKKFDLPIIEVIKGGDITKEVYLSNDDDELVNSGEFSGMKASEAKEAIIKHIEEKGIGARKTNFKLRDWVFSRQRYWGEPIPMVNQDGAWYAIDDSELPLELPEVDNYEPNEEGESPLADIDSFVNTSYNGKSAIRETDTMPNWAGSSWYYLRYIDPHNDNCIADYEKLKYWLPVDWYNGGMEHTTLHLLYSRFWHKFLYDIGAVPTEEPYQKRTSHGMILGDNGEKMSKSRGNVENPNEYVKEYGADALRLYEMFMGDYEQVATWSKDGPRSLRRFIERVVRLEKKIIDGDKFRPELETLFHQTIKKVTHDYLNLKYNTAIAQLMTLVNEIYLKESINREEYRILLILLNPVIPHITEEMYQRLDLGDGKMIVDEKWPEYIEELTVENIIEIPIQVNGKLQTKIKIARDLDKDEVLNIAKETDEIKKLLTEKSIVKEIYVPNKIVNLVMK